MALVRRPQPRETPTAEAGFFGKAPSHGDFVSNRFDRALRERLDGWLQRAISESRQTFDGDWDATFAGMPVWRFVLGAEVVGGKPVMGVMAPSADRVGRRFPLILAVRLPRYEGPTFALCARETWFDAAESLARSAGHEDLDLTAFDEMVARLPSAETPPRTTNGPPPEAKPDRDRSFWWTDDAEGPASRFASVGLPAPSEFRRLLTARPDGGLPKPSRPAPSVAPKPPPAPVRPQLTLATAAASHAGTRMRINADAWIERPDLAALADGVGDQPSAADAARLTLDRLNQIQPAVRLDELVQLAKAALGRANALLRAGAPAEEERPNAAVVALLASGGRFAVLWAGDARGYLLRDGMMRRLTRDHVEVGLRRRVARSVGGATQLTLDAVTDELLPGDRFLLASAPLLAALPERTIADLVLDGPAQTASDALIQDALIAGAAGNVTAMVVHAEPATR